MTKPQKQHTGHLVQDKVFATVSSLDGFGF